MTPQTDAIIAGLAFIERHLCEPISVGDIADAAGYSLFHFLRTFNKIARHTPYDYLIRRRLSHAARLLVETDLRVLDIALTCRFDSHEGFTRAFGRLFGMPPTTWRANKFLDQRLLMLPLQQEDLVFRQSLAHCSPTLTRLDRSYLLGWMQFLAPDFEDQGVFGQKLRSTLSDDQIPSIGNGLWEVRMLPTPGAHQEMIFWGVQVSEPVDAAGRYVIKVIEPGHFLRFSHPGLSECRGEALNYLYHTFLPKSGLTLGAPMEIFCQDETDMLLLPLGKPALSQH